MTAWLFVALGALIAVVDIAIGLFLMRRGAATAGMELAAPSGSRRAGQLLVAIAPVQLIVLSAIGFFLFGGR